MDKSQWITELIEKYGENATLKEVLEAEQPKQDTGCELLRPLRILSQDSKPHKACKKQGETRIWRHYTKSTKNSTTL